MHGFVLTEDLNDQSKDDHGSLWGSPSPLAQLAPSSPLRDNGDREEWTAAPQGATNLLGLSAEDADLVAMYLASTPVVEVVSISALLP